MEISDTHFPDFTDYNHLSTPKRTRLVAQGSVSSEGNPTGSSGDDGMEIVRHNSPLLGSAKSHYASEGYQRAQGYSQLIPFCKLMIRKEDIQTYKSPLESEN